MSASCANPYVRATYSLEPALTTISQFISIYGYKLVTLGEFTHL